MTKIRVPKDIRRVYELVRELPEVAERIPPGMPPEMDYQPTAVRVADLDTGVCRIAVVKIHWPGLHLKATIAITPDGKRRLHGLHLRRTNLPSHIRMTVGDEQSLGEKELAHLPNW